MPLPSSLTDEQKERIRKLAKRWRNAVRRGDISADFAAQEVTSEYTYPYATVSFWNSVRNEAERWVK